MEDVIVKVREDINDMVSDIQFRRINGKYSSRDVAVVTLFSGATIEFRDTEGLYDLFLSYRDIGKTDFLKSKKLVEEIKSITGDVTEDFVDEKTGTYICVLFELKNGKKYRLFPSRKFVDRDIIDNYYDAWKEKKAKENKPATANK